MSIGLHNDYEFEESMKAFGRKLFYYFKIIATAALILLTIRLAFWLLKVALVVQSAPRDLP